MQPQGFVTGEMAWKWIHLSLCCHLRHPLTEAEWTHVSPDFLDIGQALPLRPGLSRVIPAESVFTASGPNRVLLFVVDYYVVDRCVFGFVVVTHDCFFRIENSDKLPH